MGSQTVVQRSAKSGRLALLPVLQRVWALQADLLVIFHRMACRVRDPRDRLGFRVEDVCVKCTRESLELKQSNLIWHFVSCHSARANLV